MSANQSRQTANNQPAEQPAKRRRGAGRPFAKGGDPRQAHEMKKAAIDPSTPPWQPLPLEPGVSEQLAEMRYVANNRKARKGEPDSVVMLRKWMRKDLKSFFEHKSRLEAKVKLPKGKSATVTDLNCKTAPNSQLCPRCTRLGEGKPLQSCQSCCAWFYPGGRRAPQGSAKRKRLA